MYKKLHQRVLHHPATLAAILIGVLIVGGIFAQSIGSGNAVTQSGTWNINNISGIISLPTGASTAAKQPALGTAGAASADVITVQGIAGMTALQITGATGSLFRTVPSSCTQTTNFTSTTVGVANGGGSSLSNTTTCVTFGFVNNPSNSNVTFRLQDKTGTPIIWVGGANDFTILANSAAGLPIAGVTFVGGLTAIAGTNAVLNLQINGLQ